MRSALPFAPFVYKITFAMSQTRRLTNSEAKTPKYFQFTNEDVADVLKDYDRTYDSSDQDLEAIKTWLRHQPHLPEITPDRIILSFLGVNKFRVEKTKQKLDMYYTMRGVFPEMFNRHPMSPEIQKIARVATYLPMPHLMEDKSRITIIALLDENPDNYDADLHIASVFLIQELRMVEDHCKTDHFVADLTKFKTAHIMQWTPIKIRNLFLVVDKIYSSRYKGFHIVMLPVPILEKLMALALALLPEKIKKRIKIYNNLDSLFEELPKKYLPRDYGGDQKSLAELNEELLARFEDHLPRFEKLMKMRTNEALRPGKPINDDMLGFHGNFRKLDVD